MKLRPVHCGALALVAFSYALVGVTSCSAGWKDEDSKALTDAIHAQQALTRFCVGDAGCSGDQVEAVDRAVQCNLGSILVRHGQDPAGVDEKACRP